MPEVIELQVPQRADMAEQSGATVVVEAHAPEVIMLQPEDDARVILRARLSGSR